MRQNGRIVSLSQYFLKGSINHEKEKCTDQEDGSAPVDLDRQILSIKPASIAPRSGKESTRKNSRLRSCMPPPTAPRLSSVGTLTSMSVFASETPPFPSAISSRSKAAPSI